MIDDRVRGTGSSASDAEIQAATPRPRGGNQARVGLFVIAGFLSVIAVLFLMTNPATLRGRYMVFTQLPDAGGVRSGDAVQMRGVIIGRVHDFEFINGNQEVSIQLEIEGKWEVPTDSHARLAGAGLMGGQTMEIVPGGATTFFEEGDTIPSTTEVSGIMEGAEIVAGRATTVLDQVAKLLSDPTILSLQTTASESQALVTESRRAVVAMQGQVTELIASLSRSTAGLDTVTKTMNDLATAASPNLTSAAARTDSLLAQLSVTSARLDRTVASLDSILARVNSGQGSLGKLANDNALYDNLTRAADEFALLAKDLRENPKKYLSFSLIGN